jgi:glutamate N-acetyltransferase/amino-acid N-acetyltransferase
MDAAGYSGARIKPDRIQIDYDGVLAVRKGMPAPTPVEKLRKVARKKEFTITMDLGLGKGQFRIWTTDLTTKYVEFNMGE